MKDLSAHTTGIVWTTKEVMPEKDSFNEPWMDNLDQNLLFRYWKYKKCPGYLSTTVHGTKVTHKKVEGVGIISVVNCPLFDDNRKRPDYTTDRPGNGPR